MVKFRSRKKGGRRITYPLREGRAEGYGYVKKGRRIVSLNPERGKKVIPKLKKGKLGITFVDGMSDGQMKSILTKHVEKEGEQVVASRLRALQVLNKRTNPEISKKAAEMADWVYGSFQNKKLVKYPKGFQ